MGDKFTLSVGQAHELHHAFARNGWSVGMVHDLCKGDTLTKVREYLYPLLERPLEEIITREACQRYGSKRSYIMLVNCLKTDGLVSIGHVVNRSEAETLRTPNLGYKSVSVLKKILSEHGLSLASD